MMKRMTRQYLSKMTFLGLVFSFPFFSMAQEKPELAAKAAKKYMQEAEAAMADNDMATAEAYYRKAIAKDPANAEAKYNLGNLYYNKEITSQALDRHADAATTAEKKPLKHDAFHNQGNSFMKQKKYSEAVEAYKQSLRNNPKDDETRYNLALAKKMLEEEQKEGGGGESDEKDEQDQQNQDQQDKNEQQEGENEKEQSEDGQPDDKEGGDQKEDENKEGEQKKEDAGQPDDKEEQKNEKPKEGEQPQQPQQRPGQLSPQQVKNLLEAMGNEEKKVQEKINARKEKGVPVKTEKDW